MPLTLSISIARYIHNCYIAVKCHAGVVFIRFIPFCCKPIWIQHIPGHWSSIWVVWYPKALFPAQLQANRDVRISAIEHCFKIWLNEGLEIVEEVQVAWLPKPSSFIPALFQS